MTEIVKEARIETTLGSKGRIVFPAYLRKSIGLEEGDPILIELKGEKIIVTKLEEGHESR